MIDEDVIHDIGGREAGEHSDLASVARGEGRESSIAYHEEEEEEEEAIAWRQQLFNPRVCQRCDRVADVLLQQPILILLLLLVFYAVQLVPNLRRGSRTLNTRLVGANTLS